LLKKLGHQKYDLVCEKLKMIRIAKLEIKILFKNLNDELNKNISLVIFVSFVAIVVIAILYDFNLG